MTGRSLNAWTKARPQYSDPSFAESKPQALLFDTTFWDNSLRWNSLLLFPLSFLRSCSLLFGRAARDEALVFHSCAPLCSRNGRGLRNTGSSRNIYLIGRCSILCQWNDTPRIMYMKLKVESTFLSLLHWWRTQRPLYHRGMRFMPIQEEAGWAKVDLV